MRTSLTRTHLTRTHTYVRAAQGEIKVLPWTELENLHDESAAIQEQLLGLIAAGYLTINSQPRVNGAKSSDAQVGWGGDNG